MQVSLKNSKIDHSQAPVVISAKGRVLGRLATEVATILRGKDSPQFMANLYSGRKVIVTHAKDVVVTGNKMEQKIYTHHTGYIGNLKQETLKSLMNRRPNEVIRQAVKGMLPKNRLQKHWLAALEILEGDNSTSLSPSHNAAVDNKTPENK